MRNCCADGPGRGGRSRWHAAGPGCGARGRWRGLAGQRVDAPSRRLAGGPPPTGTQSSPAQRAAAHQHTQRPGQHERRRGPRNTSGTTSTARNPAHPAARPDNAQKTTGTTSTASRRATADRHTQQPGPTMPGTPAAPQAAPEEQAAPETPAEPHATLQIKRRHRRRPASARSAGFTRPRGGQLRA